MPTLNVNQYCYLGIGHELQRRSLELSELEKLRAIREAEQAVWAEAEQIKAEAVQRAREDARYDQEKMLKKVSKAQEKALKVLFLILLPCNSLPLISSDCFLLVPCGAYMYKPYIIRPVFLSLNSIQPCIFPTNLLTHHNNNLKDFSIPTDNCNILMF